MVCLPTGSFRVVSSHLAEGCLVSSRLWKGLLGTLAGLWCGKGLGVPESLFPTETGREPWAGAGWEADSHHSSELGSELRLQGQAHARHARPLAPVEPGRVPSPLDVLLMGHQPWGGLLGARSPLFQEGVLCVASPRPSALGQDASASCGWALGQCAAVLTARPSARQEAGWPDR